MSDRLRFFFAILSVVMLGTVLFLAALLVFDTMEEDSVLFEYQSLRDDIGVGDVFTLTPFQHEGALRHLDPSFDYLGCFFDLRNAAQFDAFVDIDPERFWVVHLLTPRGLSFFSLAQRSRRRVEMDLHILPSRALADDAPPHADVSDFSLVLNESAFELAQFPTLQHGLMLIGVEKTAAQSGLDELKRVLRCASVSYETPLPQPRAVRSRP